MRACMYFNIAAGAVLSAFSSFAACGGGQSQPSSPSSGESVSAPASSDSSSTAATPPAPAAPSASETSLAAAPAGAAPKRDRDLNDIRAVVAGNRDAFRACYDRALKAHHDIKGTFVLKFVVNPDGSVKSGEADQVKSEIHASDLEACAVGVIKSLRFPPSKRGMESPVSYPFNFNPKGQP